MIHSARLAVFVTNKPAWGEPDDIRDEFFDKLSPLVDTIGPLEVTQHLNMGSKIYGATIDDTVQLETPPSFHTEFFVDKLFPVLNSFFNDVNIVNFNLEFHANDGSVPLAIVKDSHGMLRAGRKGYPLSFRPVDSRWVVNDACGRAAKLS